MIQFSFTLQIPWSIRASKFTNIFCVDRKISKNKNIEVEMYISSLRDELFYINIDLRWFGRDHAGPSIELGVVGYHFSVGIYDGRHWDYDLGRWEKYDESK